MALKIEALGYLVDATDAELNAVKGGYAAIVVNDTGDFGKGAQIPGIVLGKPALDRDVTVRQLNIGVPFSTIVKGSDLALREGGGRYTIGVTGRKLEG